MLFRKFPQHAHVFFWQYAWTHVIIRHGIQVHTVTMGSYKFHGWVSWSCFNCVITERLRVTVNPQSLHTSTFVPNDRSQYPFCVLSIMWCAFDAHLDVGLASERPTPCRFIGTGYVSFPCFREDGRLLTRQNCYMNMAIHIYSSSTTVMSMSINILYHSTSISQLFMFSPSWREDDRMK